MEVRNKIMFLVFIFTLACSIPLSGSASDSAEVVFSTTTQTPVAFVVVGTVNVRSCASTSCGVVGYLYAGEPVVAECSGNWCEVENGWVYAPCLGMDGVCK